MSAFRLETNQLLEKTHRFSHKAMATEFEIFIFHENLNYSKQVAQEAFSELNRLELELSRFIENSDISRINNLKENQSTKVGIDTFECLQQCQKIFWETNGAFDITIGNLWKTFLNKDKSLRFPTHAEISIAKEKTGMQYVELDKATFTVKLLRSPLLVDLGGFGKGYALDKLAEILKEWDVHLAFIHGGRSTVLTLEVPSGFMGWPITLSDPFSKKIVKKLLLKNQALSGSGLQKGQHIIDPRNAKPVQNNKVTWAIAPNAALSDALSTAFMIMSENEIEDFCQKNEGIANFSVKN